MTTPLRVNRWTAPRCSAAQSAFPRGYGACQSRRKTLRRSGAWPRAVAGTATSACRSNLRRRLRFGLLRTSHRLRRGFGLGLRLGHLGVRRSHRPRRDHLVALAVAVRVHDAEIVLGVLVEILGGDAVARRRRFARKRNIALEHLISIAADLDTGTAAFEYLTAVRRSRPIALALLLMLMMAAAVMASTVSFALALSHHALEILVGHHPPLG